MTQDEKGHALFLKALEDLERKHGPAYVLRYSTGNPKYQPIEIPGYEKDERGRVYYTKTRKRAA